MSNPVDLDTDRQDYARGPNWHAAQARARAEWQELRELSITIACRDCGMPAGAACVNRGGGPKPTVLTKFPAHANRINDAKKAKEMAADAN